MNGNFRRKRSYGTPDRRVPADHEYDRDQCSGLRQNDLIIIPVGSTECHGAAQPLGEDTFLVTRMAEQVALKTGCTVAEPVWYGSHPYNHLGMPGTVVVPEDAFLANLRAIIAGFWNMGFRKQIFLEWSRAGRSHPAGAAPVGQEIPGAVHSDLAALADRDP